MECDIFDLVDEFDDERRKNAEDRKFLFRRELRSMVYGFGDDKVFTDKNFLE